jgi:aryl-alcohol dehydrogenase-like predicted oxidoreductase
MSPQAVEASVIESLRQLRTDYIDVLALHEPSIAMCTDPALLEMLEGFVKKGYVRSISIAGSPDAAIAGSSASHLFQFAQFQDNPFLEVIDRLRQHPATRNKVLVTHSVFGAGAFEQLSRLQAKAGASQSQSPGDMLFDYALAKNPNGIVLSSMFSQRHIDVNCHRAAAPIPQDAIAKVNSLTALR